MHRIFQAFIDNLSTAVSVDDLRRAMADAASSLDLSCFAYLSILSPPVKGLRIISTYPQNWTDHYLQNRYELIDPVIQEAIRSVEPFEWGLGVEAVTMSERQEELFEEAASFGIRYGFTVPVNDSRRPVAAVTFAANERREPFERRIKEHGRVLQLMAMYFHAHARRKVAVSHSIDGVLLSCRELECLEWAAQGKSTWDIGRIIGISRHTAAFHIENAKMKLGVRTVVQAVARLAASRR